MGTIEFKINGRKVGEIHFHNVEGIEACNYYYEYYQPQTELRTGTVSHHRSNGIETLAYLILSDMRGE